MPNIASAESHPAQRQSGLVAVDGRSFPLRSARIEARAQGGLAASILIQQYGNPYAEPLEVIYTMPLPADGAVAGYAFTIGTRTVTGRIERRETAQADYRKALLEGRTAGLLEQERADTFTQSLGNVPPGESVTVRIEVLHPLAFLPATPGRAPLWEWRFPTVVGVRYEGAAGRVPDAERLDVPRAEGEGTPVRITAALAIDGGRTLAVGPARLDRDLVLTWDAASLETEARLVEGRGLAGDDGRYALLTITPPASPRETLPRDLTILIDASGSMSGRPIEAAKSVAGALLDSLSPSDRFQILAFSTSVRDLTGGVVPAGEKALDAARRGLAKLAAGGGTEMVSALEAALAPVREAAQRQVVLLTDGDIGFEAEAAAMILHRLPADSRLHAVGIGAAPNRSLTRLAARAGRGVELLVGLEDDPKLAAARLCRATAAPVLTGLAVSGSAVDAIAPERPRDVFAGDPLTVLVALRPGGGSVEIEGRLAGSREPWRRTFQVPASAEVPESTPPLGAFFGRERVEDLELRLTCEGRVARADELDAAIEAAGLRHRIVTRHTSLVAISEDETVDPRDPRRRERLAVELPEGVSAEGVGLLGREAFPSVMFDDLGASEVLSRTYEARPRSLAVGGDVRRLTESGGEFIDWIELDATREARRIRKGRLLRLEGDTIVVEIDVEDEPLAIPEPAHRATVVWTEGGSEEVRFDAMRGTRPGVYAPGLTVRLTLVRRSADAHAGTPVRVSWRDDAGAWVEVELV